MDSAQVAQALAYAWDSPGGKFLAAGLAACVILLALGLWATRDARP